MANDKWCRHFNGIQNPECRAGVDYNTVKDRSQRPLAMPCMGDNPCATSCPLFEHYTAEEIAEDERKTNEFVRRINGFGSGESKVCPTCGEPIGGIRLYAKIEPEVFSLYVLPCNHRQGLWAGAPEWVKADGLPIDVVESKY